MRVKTLICLPYQFAVKTLLAPARFFKVTWTEGVATALQFQLLILLSWCGTLPGTDDRDLLPGINGRRVSIFSHGNENPPYQCYVFRLSYPEGI